MKELSVQQIEHNWKKLRDIIQNTFDGDRLINLNKMGVNDSLVGARYQVQLNGSVVYRGQVPTDSTTIINSIKERL